MDPNGDLGTADHEAALAAHSKVTITFLAAASLAASMAASHLSAACVKVVHRAILSACMSVMKRLFGRHISEAGISMKARREGAAPAMCVIPAYAPRECSLGQRTSAAVVHRMSALARRSLTALQVNPLSPPADFGQKTKSVHKSPAWQKAAACHRIAFGWSECCGRSGSNISCAYT